MNVTRFKENNYKGNCYLCEKKVAPRQGRLIKISFSYGEKMGKGKFHRVFRDDNTLQILCQDCDKED